MKPAKYPQLSRAKFGMDMEEEASSLLAERAPPKSIAAPCLAFVDAGPSVGHISASRHRIRESAARPQRKTAHVACVIQAEGYT